MARINSPTIPSGILWYLLAYRSSISRCYSKQNFLALTYRIAFITSRIIFDICDPSSGFGPPRGRCPFTTVFSHLDVDRLNGVGLHHSHHGSADAQSVRSVSNFRYMDFTSMLGTNNIMRDAVPK